MFGLNLRQAQAKQMALDGHNILVTGQCGTGKTHLLRAIIKEAKQNDKSVSVTATTGMACQQFRNLGAVTLHSWAGLLDGRYTNDELLCKLLGSEKLSSNKTNIKNVDLLIIDEIGMLSRKTFDQLEFICRNIRCSKEVFGGIQVVASGSFKQLPPVPNTNYGDNGEYCFTSDSFHKLFPHHVQLELVVRQNEPDLVKAIHELCEGYPSLETDELMKQLSRPLSEEANPVKLMATNFDVDFYNHDSLYSKDTPVKCFKSVDTGETHLLFKCEAPKILVLSVGSPVLLIRNISREFVNGMKGIVISTGDEGPVVDFGGKACHLKQYEFSRYDPKIGKLRAMRKQYPLKLAYAMTIHRAQGQTLPELVVDCRNIRNPGQIGVAIGRAVCKDGLQVLNYSNDLGSIKHPQCIYDFDFNECVKPEPDLSCCSQNFNEVDSHHDDESLDSDESDSGNSGGQHKSSNSAPPINDTAPSIDNLTGQTKEFPYDIDELMQNMQASILHTTPQQEEMHTVLSSIKGHVNLRPFINGVYTYCSNLFDKHCTSQTSKVSNFTMFYTDIHQYVVGNEFKKSCLALVEKGSLTPTENKICCKIVHTVSDTLIKDKSKGIVDAQINKVRENTISDKALDEPISSKLRYIGGACVAKIKYKLQEDVIRAIPQPKSKQLMNIKYKQRALLSKLQANESQLLEKTQFRASLNETLEKQGATRGLTHINDETFEFFTILYKKVMLYEHFDYLHIYGDDLINVIRQILYNDDDLMKMWFHLFNNANCKDDPKDEDDDLLALVTTSFQLELYYLITMYFLKIAHSEMLLKFKETVKEKKQALRPSLGFNEKKRSTSQKKKTANTESETPSTSKSGPQTANMVVPSEDNDVFICTVCNKACIDDPKSTNEESIGCDKCGNWFHYVCVGVKGDEHFLTRKNSKWHCPDCIPIPKKKRRYKKK